MRIRFLLSFALLAQTVLAQSPATSLSDDDKKEIRLLAANKLEGFKDLLNTIAFEDATESQRNEVILNSYLPSSARIFYDDAVRIEDDLNPEKADTKKDLSVVDYLKNVDLFYQKSAEPSIVFSNVVVSDVLKGEYVYVRAVYTSFFKGVNKSSGSGYVAVQRIADFRAEQVDKKWVVLISRVGNFNPSMDKLVMYVSAGGQSDNLGRISDLYQQAEQAYGSGKYAESLSLVNRAEELSNKPDAKLLYVKIKALNRLYQTDKKYGAELERSFSIFSGVADAQSYSSQKVKEVSDLQKQFGEVSKEQERVAFEAAKSSADLTQLKLFIQQYPNSSYGAGDMLTRRESNQKLYEEQNKVLEPDFARAAFLMKKGATGKIIASALLISLGTFLIYGNAHDNKNKVGYFDETNYTIDKYGFPVVTTKSVYSDSRYYTLYYYGSAFVTFGLITAFTRGPKKRGRLLQEKTLEKQRGLQEKYLSFVPKFNFQQGFAQYGLSLRLKF